MDTEGKLSKDEKERIKAWVEAKSKTAECPVCGNTNWIIGDHIVQPVTNGSGRVLLGGAAYPQVMLVSTECGYTRYFNAILMGLVAMDSKESSPEDKEQQVLKEPGNG